MTKESMSALGPDFDSLKGPLPVPTTSRGLEARDEVLAKLADGRYKVERVLCLCGCTGEDLVLAQVDRYRIPHRTVLCRRCGLVRADPRPSADSYADFYRYYYRRIYERPGQKADSLFAHQAANAARRFRFVLQHAGRFPATVVELGCGAGWNLVPFREAGAQVRGYDYDEEYLRAGRERGLEMEEGGITEALAVGRAYDLVVLSHVVEHMLDPVADLQRIRSLLAPGGHLFIEVPNVLRAGHPLLRQFQSAHTFFFAPPTLGLVLEKAGFRCVRIDEVTTSLWTAEQTGQPSFLIDESLAKRVLSHLQSIRPPVWWRRVLRAARRILPV